MMLAFQIYDWISLFTVIYFTIAYIQNRNKPMPDNKPYACGRVHLGPVEDTHVGTLSWQRCSACGNKLSEDEQLIYWRTKRAAIKCREVALLEARTK